MIGRQRLPNRRPSITDRIMWLDREWSVCFGFDPAGNAREVFADGAKVGADMDGLIDDACVALSIALQSGSSAADMAARLGREGVDPAAGAASLLGLIARRAEQIEREEGPKMEAVYTATGRGRPA